MRSPPPERGERTSVLFSFFLSCFVLYIIDFQVVSAVLEEQHKVFVDCLNEAKDMEHQHRVDLRMLWETVGLRVSHSGVH